MIGNISRAIAHGFYSFSEMLTDQSFREKIQVPDTSNVIGLTCEKFPEMTFSSWSHSDILLEMLTNIQKKLMMSNYGREEITSFSELINIITLGSQQLKLAAKDYFGECTGDVGGWNEYFYNNYGQPMETVEVGDLMCPAEDSDYYYIAVAQGIMMVIPLIIMMSPIAEKLFNIGSQFTEDLLNGVKPILNSTQILSPKPMTVQNNDYTEDEYQQWYEEAAGASPRTYK